MKILASLPELTSLDAHYIDDTALRHYEPPPCQLRNLTIYIGRGTTRNLWTWINRLSPSTSLESLTVRNDDELGHKTVLGDSSVPPSFLCRLAQVHGRTLKRLVLDALYMTLGEFRFVCETFGALEHLVCVIVGGDMVCFLLSARLDADVGTGGYYRGGREGEESAPAQCWFEV